MMKYVVLIFSTIILFTATATRSKTSYFACAGKTIALLDSSEAAKDLLAPDDYTKEHTSFDLAIRLNTDKGLTEQKYLEAAAKSAHNWGAEEASMLRASFRSIDSFSRVTGIDMHLPDTLKMIKTDAKEEFGAEGYTRTNHIMLNTRAQPISLHLVAHELWHVISRYNNALRDAAYAAFHFRPCNNIIYKPAMKNKVITNPDCPYLMHYVTVTVDNKPQDVALILYSKKISM